MNINEAENINTDISAEENKTQYKGLLKATGLFGGVQGLNMLTALIRNKLTAVILGTSGFGLISVYNSATTMLGNATNFGLPISAVRNLSDINKENDYEKSARYVGVVRSWILLTSLLGLLVCIVLSTQLSLWTFGDKDYTRAFYFLSVMVAATTYAAGELAILKAVRQMREIALVSVYSVLGSLFIVVPIYYFMGESGVIPALLVLSLWILAVTLRYSLKHFPFTKDTFRISNLREGTSLIRLGASFVLAGLFCSGAEYVIRAYMLNNGSIDEVGLYNAGYALCVTYLGVVFTSIDNDYFPKLSGIGENHTERNSLVNNQIEITLLMLTPLLVGLLVFVPIILPLLYSAKFAASAVMVRYVVFFMFFRAFILPMSYITLSKGDSLWFLAIELIYDVIFVSFVIIGFRFWGLKGCGIALALSAFSEMLLVGIFVRQKYRFSLSRDTFKIASIMFVCSLSAFAVTFMEHSLIYWVCGVVVLIISSLISLKYMNEKSEMKDALMRRFFKK